MTSRRLLELTAALAPISRFRLSARSLHPHSVAKTTGSNRELGLLKAEIMAPITATYEYLSRLGSLAEPAEVLQKHGFITQLLSEEELLLKRRCSGCNKGSILTFVWVT
jgi:hypothetical protein